MGLIGKYQLGEVYEGWALGTQVNPVEQPNRVDMVSLHGADVELIDAEVEWLNAQAVIFRYVRVWVSESVRLTPPAEQDNNNSKKAE